jgi:DnaJ-class molecular chaperone
MTARRWKEWKPGRRKCHGCGGRGWVLAGGTVAKCPVCNGEGYLEDKPDVQWRAEKE